MYNKFREHLKGNRLYLGIILVFSAFFFDRVFLPILWLLVVGRDLWFVLLNVAVHLNAFALFLGYLALITALTHKRTKKWLFIFTLVYFIGGFILLFNILFLPADAQLLASQTLRWPLIASYSLF